MACSEEVMEYNNITDILVNTFGALLHRDIIYSIVESCCGDVNHAANAIMSITSEDNPETIHVQRNTLNYLPSSNSGCSRLDETCSKYSKDNATSCSTSGAITVSTNMDPQTSITSMKKLSYATVSTTSKKKNVIPRHINNSYQRYVKKDPYNYGNIWSEQITRIMQYHNQGIRTLIIMRGAPGSGKTYLAHQIQEMTVGTKSEHVHVYSADDYFMINGYYKYDKMKLQDAHASNQHRAFQALKKGVSPVIIDNTNGEYWEIEPYAKAGVYNGYILEVLSPSTPWAKNAEQLSRRNKHRVPVGTIKKYLDKLLVNITSDNLITYFKLVYRKDMKPPILRCFPEIITSCNGRTVSELEHDNFDKQNRKLDVENNNCNPLTIPENINNNYEAVISEAMTFTQQTSEHINNNVESLGELCNELENIDDNSELNYNEDITRDQNDITVELKEKEILNNKVETLTINEHQNVLESELINQDNSKEQIKQSEQNNESMIDQTKENRVQYPSVPTNYVKNELTLCNDSEPEASTSTKFNKNDVDFANFLEEFQKVENEWENGEAWEENSNLIKQLPITENLNTSMEAKLPRRRRIQQIDNTLHTFDNENDWRKIYKSMPSFTDSNNLLSVPIKNVIETKSTETCMEVGDTETSAVKSGYKIIPAVSRDINLDYLSNMPEKIPENRKFDKSTMTNELTAISKAHRCKNEDKHFIRFRNMFKHLKKEDLRDIFEKCCGDVNWAVSIVIDDTVYNQIQCITLDEQSETEEDSDESCDCTSIYGIIPDITPYNVKNEHVLHDKPSTSTTVTAEASNFIKKHKKDPPVSDESLALKRQIEKNIVISDQHYSEEFLKVRKMRRGVRDDDVGSSQNIGVGITLQSTDQLENFAMSTIDTCNIDDQEVCAPSAFQVLDSEYNCDDESSYNEVEKTININIGHEFLNQLDEYFGRTDTNYSDNIVPRINIPISMLNEINALWMESLMCQLETESKTHEDMIKQDEELAREIMMKQLEISRSGEQPEALDFKEIMDMEFALSLYRKDCEELLQKERPTDMAAKLSLKKLHDLFPEIPQGDLDEIFMAHNYEFQTTVGVLLDTQGRTDVTLAENGINKFIMAQELKRQEQFLAAEKQRLMDEKWPSLPNQVDMGTVNVYRDKASQHYAQWSKNFGKAKDMVKTNMAVANYYNNLAGLHLLKYEHANSVAAVSLMQMHAQKSGSDVTLDLHYLRVDEAKAALEVFLDTHIQRLGMLHGRDKKHKALFVITGRGLHSRGGPKIKPAIMSHLKRRGLHYKELNPGLLSVKISAGDKMSYQVT